MAYTRDDVQTHSSGFGRDSRPAVNVKVYKSLRDSWDQFVKDEQPDARFTLDWIEEHVSDDHMNDVGGMCCQFEFEYFSNWAQGDEDAIFPVSKYGRIDVFQEGRSGGWAVVSGLPEIEDWDAVLLAKWRKFERIGRDIANGIPYQILASLYANEFEAWADEQADESISNAELPVDQALAAR